MNSAREYYEASVERMRQAWQLHQAGSSYALAMYCAGLAVECMLRAYRWKKDQTIDSRHDLKELLKTSDLIRLNEDNMKARGHSEERVRNQIVSFQTNINDVVVLWNNLHRFRSESGVKAFLLRVHRVQGVRGDPLKKNSLDLLKAAQAIHDRGVVLWTSKTK